MITVFPLNGFGERFLKAGYKIPKVLLPVRGKPLLQYVLEHYTHNGLYVFPSHDEVFRHIILIVPQNSVIIRVSQDGKPVRHRGPVETLLYSYVLDEVNTEDELLIADGDSFMEDSNELTNAIEKFRQSDATGGVTVRKTKDPWASFANVENGWVTETREKDPFTDWSTTGPYWWKHGSDFVKSAKKAVSNKTYYISPCYNYHISSGGKVIAAEVKTFTHLGTPESYVSYSSSSDF